MINSIASNIRNHIGGSTNQRLRKAGYIPGVIYGKNINTLPIEIENAQLERLVRHGGEKSLINLDIGGQSYTAYIKEIQRHPVTRKIMHLDFQQVNANEKIHVSIPVILKGKAYVEKSGVVIQQQLKELEVECVAGNIPPKLEYDISHFKPGDTLKVADMEFGEEINVIDELQSVIASIAKVEKIEDNKEEVYKEDIIEIKDKH